jgi:hypothetical protein
MRPWLIGSAPRPDPLIIEYDSLSLYRQAQGRRRIHLDRSTLADRWGQRASTRQHPDDRSGTLLDLPAPGASCRGDTLRRPQRRLCAERKAEQRLGPRWRRLAYPKARRT